MQVTIPPWKTCQRCRRRKRAGAFSKSRKNVTGLQAYCKDCQAKIYLKKRGTADESLELIKAHNIRHLTECYANAVGFEARMRLRKAITQAETGE